MLIVNEVIPMLNGEFILAMAAGIVFFILSTRCRRVQMAERLQFVGFCGCATGSVTIIESFARIYLH